MDLLVADIVIDCLGCLMSREACVKRDSESDNKGLSLLPHSIDQDMCSCDTQNCGGS